MVEEEAGLEEPEVLVGVLPLHLSEVAVAGAEAAAGGAAIVDSVVAVGEAALRAVVEVGAVVATALWTIRLARATEAAACSIRRADIALRLHC